VLSSAIPFGILCALGGGENAEYNPGKVQAARGASTNMLPAIS
jgi:hypothetical protein